MTTNSPRRYAQVGIDRLVRLEWVDLTARLVQAGADLSTTKSALREAIQGRSRSQDASVRGSVDKTLTILLRVWATPGKELEPLRDDGLRLLGQVDTSQRIALHWGMIMAAYPFWGAVASVVGRLLRTQGAVVSAQVQRRVRELYGERETVARRVRYLLRSYVDWGVLREMPDKGVFGQGNQLSLDQPGLQAWMVEALLRSLPEHSMDYSGVQAAPGLFPFAGRLAQADLLQASSQRLSVSSAGFQQHIVSIKRAG